MVALLACVMMNAQGAKKQDGQPFTLDDFLAKPSRRFRVIEDDPKQYEGLTPAEKLALICRSTLDPEIQIQRIKGAFQGRTFGKWSVENG